jgi:hypothetical protein
MALQILAATPCDQQSGFSSFSISFVEVSPGFQRRSDLTVLRPVSVCAFEGVATRSTSVFTSNLTIEWE